MLDTLLNRRLSDAECTAFHASYEEFIDLLHSLTAQSCRSPLDLLHELARLQSSLMRLQERIIEKESPQASLLKSALLLTNFEIRLIFTRLRYPSIADPVSVEIPKSPLFLSEQFTPTDIMELATALQLPEPYAASMAHGSIWRHLSMCFPELSTFVSTTRSSVAIRTSTESCV